MEENKINTFDIDAVHQYLDQTFISIQERCSKHKGHLLRINGILTNVEQAYENSKYNIVYTLIVKDKTGQIEVEVKKDVVEKLKNNTYVEILGIPKFNIFNKQVTNKFLAYSINLLEVSEEIEAIQAKVSTQQLLKTYRPIKHSFPDSEKIKLNLIFSSASNVQIQQDFYKHINGYLDNFIIKETKVSLSNEDALADAIQNSSGFDILVIIRGGGNHEVFEIFNSEKVLKVFSSLDIYRVVGLGHNTDVTLLDSLADHSAFTPLDAGLHLKEQIETKINRNLKIKNQGKTINYLKETLENKTRSIEEKEKQIIQLRAQNTHLEKRTDTTPLIDKNDSLKIKNDFLAKENLTLTEEVKATQSKLNNMLIVISFVGIIIGFILGKFL